jgi:hypothetical protein
MDWIASNMAAGCFAGVDGTYGTADDARINAGSLAIIPKIASITIKGAVTGTASGTDGFGFVAREIGAMKIGGLKIALNSSTNVFAVGTMTNDTFVREVA